jgi:hypothetical protein
VHTREPLADTRGGGLWPRGDPQPPPPPPLPMGGEWTERGLAWAFIGECVVMAIAKQRFQCCGTVIQTVLCLVGGDYHTDSLSNGEMI